MEGVQNVVQGQWTNMSASDPLLALLIALRYKTDTHARRVARILLDRAIGNYYIPSLEASPASMYRAIVQYHHLCKTALKEVVQVLRNAGPSHTAGSAVKMDTNRASSYGIS
ncbi:hypothetical protein DAEQUDRAFT_811540 [Daedalea quercina L-15889]|uniref:Uncharacterized protein n=1 Tax=Daedalea quercina L-15889 TaxID=1314783 RepID=A0A165QE11_9APHY|nr:hypothetical protein DAEQUDRAFT_811540 [Daedalea quercina L-15889]